MPKSEKSLYQLVHVQMPCDLRLRMDSYSNESETEIDLFSSFTLIILANSANMPVHRHAIFILFIFTFFTFSHCVLTEISVWLSNQYEIMNILWKKRKHWSSYIIWVMLRIHFETRKCVKDPLSILVEEKCANLIGFTVRNGKLVWLTVRIMRMFLRKWNTGSWRLLTEILLIKASLFYITYWEEVNNPMNN